MPDISCDICCNILGKALSRDSFYQTVLSALCEIYTAQTAVSETSAIETNVASSASSVALVAADAAIKGLAIFNDSTQVLKIKYGTTASATSFTVSIAAGAVFNMPTPLYGGKIDGIWASANGFARITKW